MDALCVQQLAHSFASKAKIISITPKNTAFMSGLMLPTVVGSFYELRGFLDTQSTKEALNGVV